MRPKMLQLQKKYEVWQGKVVSFPNIHEIVAKNSTSTLPRLRPMSCPTDRQALPWPMI